MQHVDVIARIQELCRERGWTYYRLAKAAGIPYSTLNTMLRKTNTPTVPTLMKLCEGFGITLGEFFDASGGELDGEQRRWLELWEQLDDRGRQLALAYLRGLLDRQG